MSDSVRASFVNLREFEAQLKRLENAPAEQALVTAGKAGGVIIRNAAAEKAPKKTRTLARSIHIEVLESSRYRVWMAIGTDVVYAAIHEFGGVILPKHAKFLAIPIGDLVGSPRLHDLRFAKRGNLYVLEDAGGNVQYVLKSQVVIPARPYMRPAWDENIDRAVREMGEVLKAQIERAAR